MKKTVISSMGENFLCISSNAINTAVSGDIVAAANPAPAQPVMTYLSHAAPFCRREENLLPPQRRADKHARTVVAQRHSRKNVITDEAMTPTNVRSHLKVTMPRKIPIAVGNTSSVGGGRPFQDNRKQKRKAASARKNSGSSQKVGANRVVKHNCGFC